MDGYIEETKARHEQNPKEERAYHNHVVDSLGLRGAAKQHIIQERNSAAVAHLIGNADVRAAISKLDDRSQVEALKRIREGESAEPETENDATDKHLGPKATRMPGHTRRQLVRD